MTAINRTGFWVLVLVLVYLSCIVSIRVNSGNLHITDNQKGFGVVPAQQYTVASLDLKSKSSSKSKPTTTFWEGKIFMKFPIKLWSSLGLIVDQSHEKFQYRGGRNSQCHTLAEDVMVVGGC